MSALRRPSLPRLTSMLSASLGASIGAATAAAVSRRRRARRPGALPAPESSSALGGPGDPSLPGSEGSGTARPDERPGPASVTPASGDERTSPWPAARVLDQMFRLSPELVSLIDLDARFTRLNPAWTDQLGYPVEHLVGRHIAELVHPDDLQPTLFEFNRALHEGSSRSFQNRYRCADGTYRWLHWNCSVDHERGAVYSVAHDITATKMTEQALAHARDQALEASRLKSQFLATMSHEIRTPMNGVIGLSELLAGTTLDETQRRYVEGIRVAGTALLSVINDILDFSKIEAGRFVLEELDFPVHAVIQEVVGLVGQAARAKGLELAVDIDPALPAALRGDPGRLRQVVLNLVGNAIKFTAQGSVTIRVDLLEPAESGLAVFAGSGAPAAGFAGEERVAVRFEVADTGVGMDAATVGKLFQPFTQADASTTRTYGGTGLGLAISRQLVEAMGGWISVQSEPGIGTTFRAALPLGRAEGDEGPTGMPAVLVVAGVPGRAEDRVRLLARWSLRGQAATDPDEALEALRRAAVNGTPFDVVLLEPDAGDPGPAHGVDLAHRIAASATIPSVPVVLVTAGEPLEPSEARQARVHAVLTSPVMADDLRQALLAACRPTTSEAAPERAAPERGRLLLVEDNEINQTVAVGILERLGFTVDVAVDGVEALDRVGDQRYQAILMDCHMPRMDGYTATARLRERPDTAHLPIIAMTANAMKEDRDRCLDAGMDDYLAKPVRARDVEATLLRWIDREHRPTSATGATGAPGASGAGAGGAPPVPAQRSSVVERLDDLAGDGSPAERELVRTIARSFLDRVPDLLAGLDEALAHADDEAGQLIAHSLKGAAANLGADRLAAACQQLEDLVERGRLEEAAAVRTALDAVLTEALTEIERYVTA